ncbi:MAG TPA: ABC transporter permease [Candidatus Eisenbergiella merdigallinarum]|uniref:ABC transporter permease n=1 Tax=Candidatus Eisenbergiella merdigallinarum TaxID=2838552 RepID=A0A9D2MUF6_9FIRM|nr:ABC transporter permease [Candidatus Eisenbergiella merdigallinarum]
MLKFYSIPYLKRNRATTAFLAVSSFLTALLLSFFLTFFHNLWMDRIYQLSGTEKPAVTPLIILYGCLLTIACLGLVLMLHSAFSITMNNRLHQLGILESAGATPRQIRSALVEETLLTAPLPLLAGTAAGVGAGWLLWRFLVSYGTTIRDPDYRIVFSWHPLLLAGCLGASLLTLAVSTWIPARKLSRISPLDAIRWGGEAPVVRMRRFRLLSALAGVSGELAQKSIYARRKAFRTSTLSLFLSFLVFTTFLNLQAMSSFSTQETYFDRYRDIWDFEIAVEPGREKDFGDSSLQALCGEIRRIDGVQSCLAWRKFSASAVVSSDRLSPQVRSVGPENLLVNAALTESGGWRISTPLYILDAVSFDTWCRETGISPRSQAVAVNRIWDRVNSRMSDRTWIPLLDPSAALPLKLSPVPAVSSGSDRTSAPSGVSADLALDISVESFASTAPRWKEEPGHDALALIVSEDRYWTLAPRLESAFSSGPFTCIVKAESEDVTPQVEARLNELLQASFPDSSAWSLDSRLQEERTEPLKRRGFNLVMGILAALFSTVGLANVFSTILGQIPQRRREFARYFSAGLSLRQMKRILCMEALILSLKPLLFSLLLNIPFVVFCMEYTGIPLSKYREEIPLLPLIPFTAFVLFFTGLAYWLGAKRVLKGDLMEALRDETML